MRPVLNDPTTHKLIGLICLVLAGILFFLSPIPAHTSTINLASDIDVILTLNVEEGEPLAAGSASATSTVGYTAAIVRSNNPTGYSIESDVYHTLKDHKLEISLFESDDGPIHNSASSLHVHEKHTSRLGQRHQWLLKLSHPPQCPAGPGTPYGTLYHLLNPRP